jgi:hypothetical protein
MLDEKKKAAVYRRGFMACKRQKERELLESQQVTYNITHSEINEKNTEETTGDKASSSTNSEKITDSVSFFNVFASNKGFD